MAISNTEVILEKEIQNWYSRINNILKRDKQTTIKVPKTVNEPILFDHAKALKNKLEQMKTDKFYSKAKYENLSDIQEGKVVLKTNQVNLEKTISSIETTIRCRNEATYNHGTHHNGSNGNIGYNNYTYSNIKKENKGAGYTNIHHGNVIQQNIKKENKGNYVNENSGRSVNHYANCTYGWYENGKNANGYQPCAYSSYENGYHGNGSCSDSYNNNTPHENGIKTNGKEIDVGNTNTVIEKK